MLGDVLPDGLEQLVHTHELQLRPPAVERHVCDEILGALLRLAARDGGDDCAAVLVVLHMIESGARRLARRFGGDMVLGELTVQIRSWTGREWMHAANLLCDTERALCRELGGPRNHRGSRNRVILVDPAERDWDGRMSLLDRAADDESAHWHTGSMPVTHVSRIYSF